MEKALEDKLDDAVHNLVHTYLGTEAKRNYIHHLDDYKMRVSINHESEGYRFVAKLYKADEYWPPYWDPKIKIGKYYINLRIGNYIHIMIGWYLRSGVIEKWLGTGAIYYKGNK